MKNFIRLVLATILVFSLNASESSESQPLFGAPTVLTPGDFINFFYKLSPSMRMFTNPSPLPEKVFLRRHFAEVKNTGKETHTYIVHAAGASSTVTSAYTVTSNPYSILSPKTSLNIDDRWQDVFLVARNTLGHRSFPLLHYSRDYVLKNFSDGEVLCDGTFDKVKELISSLGRHESPVASAGASSPSTAEDQQRIETIYVQHVYANLGKPHAIALVTTTAKEALFSKVVKEALRKLDILLT